MKDIAGLLLDWYALHARKLPWRQKNGSEERPDPYHVWISEIMLQQTRVEAVKGYYQRFLEYLPEVADLAQIPEDELMKLWQGLGYYNRARNLQKAAAVIMEEYHGVFPDEYDQLLKLPGIGEYTAGAIASIAFGKRVPAVDGNVYRIYTRLMGDDSDITKTGVKRRIREDVMEIMPEKETGSFNQAWMDLGATVCLPNGEPLCDCCPLSGICLAKEQGNMKDYPVKPVKKPRKQQERTVLLLEYQGKYLIQKRPPKGLLAGLWEFPAQEGKLSLEQLKVLLEQWSVKGDQIELLGKGEHIFSHVEWHMLGYLVHLDQLPELEMSEEAVWADVAEIEKNYSIPSAYQCYYQKIIDLKRV